MKPHGASKPGHEGAVRPSSRKPGAAQTVATLFGIGTRRCRLAAALVVVMVGLAGHTANQAFARAEGTVLYLDAPAVSTDRATRAGETAQAHHSDPRSSVSPDALAWLGVRGPRGDDTEAPPQDAAGAFASVTAPDTEDTPGITAEAAYAAGETMLAQVEDGAPAEDGGPDEDALAAAGAVRPELGDGTRASEGQPSADYEAPPAEQPTTSDPASSPEPVVPVAEPSGDKGLALEVPTQTAPAQTELAAAPSEDASPAPEISLDTEPDYGAMGPISGPVPTPEPSAEPETQEEEIQEPKLQEPETQDEEIQEPEDDGGELAGTDAVPVASPGPADETAYEDPASNPEPAEEPAYDDPATTPDTGPTSGESGDVALAPTSSPPPKDDGPDDLASASPASEESAPEESAPEESAPEVTVPEDGSEAEVSEEQISEVVVVQESDTGEGAEGADSTITQPPNFALPGDDIEDDPTTAIGAPSSDETETEPGPPAEELPAGESTDDGADEEAVPTPEFPDEQPSDQTDTGCGETASSSPKADTQGPAADTPHGDGRVVEGTADPRPKDDAPLGGADRRSKRPREDHRDDGGDRGHSGAGSPEERSRRIENDGGGEAVQEKVHENTGWFSGEQRDRGAASGVGGGAEEPAPTNRSAEPHPEERTAGEPARPRSDTGPVASQSAVDEVTATPETRPADGKVRAQRTPPMWDRQDVPPSRPRSSEALATDRRAAAERAEERREARRAERFAARVAERKAERKAVRIATRRAAKEQAAVEQAALERAAVREQRRQNRPAAGGAFDVREAAPPAGRRNAPAHQDPVPQSAAVGSDPVRQVSARRFVPVEQPAAADLPPARQEPVAQVRAESRIRRPFGSGGAAGQASGVARVSKSANRSVGR
ncbi:hypothetical protein GBA63_19685 [Rubrobacter tropicus]|uniref:Uncharacterized protein n=1 Tax=Rubrobacter tropicus TaxID=2653851 RepID=A0A6G8QDV1_9ACTN|nr:hypothetical protein [Rubrobacter tropicus]QIN84622.1 hypothetical protein GBA63_19685 [Rubrobacter tropicus]